MLNLETIKDNLVDKVLELSQATGDIVPVISTIANMARFNRFKKRINKHEDKIKKIFQLISESDVEFFAEKVGTMVFEKIMNDQEDDKAEFLLLGFENCVKNKITEEDLIIYYFDLLSELRAFDLKRLLTLSGRIDVEPLNPKKNSKEAMLIEASDKKLRRLSLINAGVTWNSEIGEAIDRRKDIEITDTGNRFLNFIGQ